MVSLKKIFAKYKNIILYLMFGVLTTVVNVISFWLAAHIVRLPTMPSTIIAWVLAVQFAYFTNRRWVFGSEAHLRDEIAKEIGSFFTCRLVTGFVDWTCMFVFVGILNFNDLLIKLITNVLVIVLNYIASKLVIFKKEV